MLMKQSKPSQQAAVPGRRLSKKTKDPILNEVTFVHASLRHQTGRKPSMPASGRQAMFAIGQTKIANPPPKTSAARSEKSDKRGSATAATIIRRSALQVDAACPAGQRGREPAPTEKRNGKQPLPQKESWRFATSLRKGAKDPAVIESHKAQAASGLTPLKRKKPEPQLFRDGRPGKRNDKESPKRLRKLSGSTDLAEKAEDVSIGGGKSIDKSRDETFRDLFGNIVVVRAPSKSSSKLFEAELRPWRELEPSDIEHLSSDEVAHYEKHLNLTSKRDRQDRLARLVQLSQKNTLLLHMGGTQADVVMDPWGLHAFLAKPAKQQQEVGAGDLKRLERLAFLFDNELLGLSERRERLTNLLREQRSDEQQHSGTRSLATLLISKPQPADDVKQQESPSEEGDIKDVSGRIETSCPSSILTVELHRESGVKLGMAMKRHRGGGIEIVEIADGFIHNYNESVPAEKRLEVGQIIVEVNGSIDRDAMLKTIMSPGQETSLYMSVRRKDLPKDASNDETSRPSVVFSVDLQREPGEKLGIVHTQNTDDSIGIVDISDGAIRNYNEAVSAEKRVEVGQIIVEVNGSRDRATMLKTIMFPGQVRSLHISVRRKDLPEETDDEVYIVDDACFEVGQLVERRDDDEEWGVGFVTSVTPLLVTVQQDRSQRGHTWPHVRQIQKVVILN